MYRQSTSSFFTLQALQLSLFEAKSCREAAKSKREIVITRLEEKDDANLDKQQVPEHR
jgi:hypothetical protein